MRGRTISSLGSILLLATQCTSVFASEYSTPTAAQRCLKLAQTLSGSFKVNVTYVPAGQPMKIRYIRECDNPIGHKPFYTAIENVCRVEATIPTSNRSQVQLEAWLPDPDVWTGRFLATGNGAFGGCFMYDGIVWGAGVSRMAAVNTNNGHWGYTAEPLLNNEDVLTDFVWRALKVEHDVGLEITEAYYGRKADKSYYSGCSTGGRQGMYLAQNYPDLYDGIIAGAPAINMQHLIDQFAVLGVKNGFRSNPADTKPIIGIDDFPVITAEVLKQCDLLDGVKDGIIDEPDRCHFMPERILCTKQQLARGNTTGICLTKEQVEVIRAFFTPIYGPKGEVLIARFDPGFTSSTPYMLNGLAWGMALDGYRYTIYNDSSYSIDNFSMKDIILGDKINPGGWSTWNTNLSKMKKAGTKLLSYHGTADGIIPSGNTINYYKEVKSTMKESLDPFWKHFVIPGMDHCFASTSSASAPWNFGQYLAPPQGLANDSAHNILSSLIDWVEKDITPKEIIGTKFVKDDPKQGIDGQRRYCPYPKRSVLRHGKNPKTADSWKCV